MRWSISARIADPPLGLALGCNSSPPSRQTSTAASPATARQQATTATPTTAATATAAATAAAADPASIPRTPVADAHAKVEAGKALLVCAYGDRSKCAGLGIGKGISWTDLTDKLPDLDKRQEIILYCA